MRLCCSLDVEILYAHLKNSFAQNFPLDAELRTIIFAHKQIQSLAQKNPS
jgi:hypothetical protein